MGVVAAYIGLSGQGIASEVRAGWTGSPYAGSSAADPLTRAIVARTGLLALARSETIYFTTNRDSDGRDLIEGCTYDIDGWPFPARWWSITLYAADNYLPRNDDGALSVDATRMPTSAGGRWSARVGPEPGPQGRSGWVSSRAGGRFSLTLRLYNPTHAALSNARVVPLPRVARRSCSRGLS